MKEFLKQLIKNNRFLFERIWEFNFLPLRYINKEQLRSILPEVSAEKLLDWPEGEKAFSKLVLKRLGLQNEYFFDFIPVYRRVALLDERDIVKLITYCGAVLQRERIVRLITKTECLEFEKRLGHELYLFAVKRAPLLMGKFGLTSAGIDQTQDLSEDVLRSGLWCLEACFAEEPLGLTRRLRLKLSPQFECNFDKNVEKAVQKQVQNLLHRLLRYEVRQPWLFTS